MKTHARTQRSPCQTAGLIAIVAICLCTAVRLDAVVIDDFEGPVKWAKGGGGTNYFIWGLTNGQMVIHTNPPIPTPPSSPVKTYDNVYWPEPQLPEGNLEGGRTLELRMDLNHTSADDLFLLLMCGGVNADADSVYSVFIDRNEVALSKYRSRFTTFYWDTLTTTNENVTVKLALTRTNSSLAITVKVVDKGNQRATLYERTFVDGPGQDGPAVPPDPHGLGYFTSDEGAPFTNFTYAAAGCWQMIFTSPPPLEMLLDNLEYDVYHPPHLEISPATSNAVDLNWRLPLDEHIVVEADQLTGPWCPCPQPYTRTNDVFCLTMPCAGPQKFFNLTPGRQFVDDFSGAQPTWMPVWVDSGEEWIVTNGVLQLNWTVPTYPAFILAPLGTNVEAYLRDFYASVDILDWEPSATNWSVLALMGRTQITSPNNGVAYWGGLTVNADGIPGNVEPWILVSTVGYLRGSPFDMQQIPPPYRLQFSLVDTNISFRVLSLTTGQVIRQMSRNDSNFTQGFVGVWVNGRKNDTFTITADNFFLSGTKP